MVASLLLEAEDIFLSVKAKRTVFSSSSLAQVCVAELGQRDSKLWLQSPGSADPLIVQSSFLP